MSEQTTQGVEETLAGFRALSQQAAALEQAHGYAPGSGPVVVTHAGLDMLLARLEAADRVVALLREYLPHITTLPPASHAETDDELGRRHREFQRIKWAMVDELRNLDATTTPPAGDEGVVDGE